MLALIREKAIPEMVRACSAHDLEAPWVVELRDLADGVVLDVVGHRAFLEDFLEVVLDLFGFALNQ